jgi:hypothetical protein
METALEEATDAEAPEASYIVWVEDLMIKIQALMAANRWDITNRTYTYRKVATEMKTWETSKRTVFLV